MNKGINTDKTIKKSTKEIFEEFYKKPFEEITKEDIGDGVEMDWGPDVGGEIITDDYDPNDPFYSESNIKHIKKIIEEYENGTLKTEVHDLIEPDIDDDENHLNHKEYLTKSGSPIGETFSRLGQRITRIYHL